jgi:hypothetical protein
MRQLPAVWLFLFAITAGGAVVTYTRCPGCIDRNRVNRTCEWTGDTAFPIDTRDAAHQKHLVADAQLAEELAIRHADAEFGRRFGVEHHGGLLDSGRFRNECLSRMFSAIENNHAVTSEQIRGARGQRDHTFDLAASLLFLPLYSLAATISGHWLCRRYADERNVRLVATGIVSIAVSLLGLQALRLWLAIWEVVRVGNGHMTGMRAASYTRWSQQYVGADFVAGIFLFWLIALYCCRTTAARICVENVGPISLLEPVSEGSHTTAKG